MNTIPHPSGPPRARLAWRGVTSVIIASSFLVVAFTGIILFVSPPGRVANWTNWTILGLRKHEWGGLHICFSALFLLAAFAHVFFNWRPLQNYFKDRLTRRVGFRKEWVAALAICSLVFLGVRANITPFSSLMAFNERVKQSWEEPRERAPVPHAELLTLTELSRQSGVELGTATNRLFAAGVKGAAPDVIIEQLANQNNRSAKAIHDVIIGAAPLATKPGESQGHGGGGYGKAGGGPGRKTLAEYCRDEGITLGDALTRLEGKGIKASAELTMREIAVNNGYSKPYELLEILKGK